MTDSEKAAQGQKRCSRKACDAPNPHSHCRVCRFPIEYGGTLCGECACEDDGE